MRKFKQGIFNPKNPNKWVISKKSITNGQYIRYMSSYELKAFRFLDEHPSILKISSEPFPIPYISPLDNKEHRYFPDLIVKTHNKNFLVEIKPLSQVEKPKQPKINRKKSLERYIEEFKTWEVNQAKWNSAREFCSKNNLNFLILTEKELKI